MEDWSKHQVKEWALQLRGVDQESAARLFEENVTGTSLKLLDVSDLERMGVKFGPAKVIINAKNEMQGAKEKQRKPFPVSDSYTEGDILSVAESGASDFIEFCHEFKYFLNTTDRTKMNKFIKEVIRFAAACMNGHTNGTIHFGILDTPHGEICGVLVDSKEKEDYDTKLNDAIKKCFQFKHRKTALICIKPPRFVEVLNKDLTSTGKFVIEVDVVPHHTMCKDEVFHTYSTYAETKDKQFFVREGRSSRNLLAPTTSDKKRNDYKWYVDNVGRLSELRRQSEEKHQRMGKSHRQGSRLCHMITGGTSSLDRSYYQLYIVVTDKPHSSSIQFFLDLKPLAVCGFNYQLAKRGQFYINNRTFQNFIQKCFNRGKAGRSDKPMWAHVQTALCQTTVPFLCSEDVFQRLKFLVVFIVPSQEIDHIVETFSTFYQELKDTRQMLFLCNSENAFTSWKHSIEAWCKEDITDRSIYELSGAEINGTVLSLLSDERRSSRFLPGAGGSRVILEQEVEHTLTALDVLCVNQCEGGSEDQVSIEQNLYRRRETWRSFSEQSDSKLRAQFQYITDTHIPELSSKRKACGLLNIKHEPRSGGTTLAKQTLWALRETHRCAVLNNDAELETVAEQVLTLLKYGCADHKPPVPVLLMIDDFGDLDVVFLQQLIEEQCLKSIVQSRFPQVILLNCIRCTLASGPFDPTEDTVFIKNQFKDHTYRVPEEAMTPVTCPIRRALFKRSLSDVGPDETDNANSENLIPPKHPHRQF